MAPFPTTAAGYPSVARPTGIDPGAGGRTRIFVIAVLAVAVLIALFVRVAPLVEGGDRLRYQCISEDGYLMLTIARNLALGRGFSISNGEIATNGTQPLMTLIDAACFWATGGAKLRGLYPVVGVQFIVSVLTAIALHYCTKRWFYRGAQAPFVALLAAGLWFASPSSVMHSQNGLETGLYALLTIVSVGLYDRFRLRLETAASPATGIVLGAALGLTFLARNDACLLIGVLLLIHLVRAGRQRALARAFLQAGVIGATSVVVALPWLWFNVARFGHVVPVSGRAEALHIAFAHNLRAAFVALVENASLLLRVPASVQDRGAAQLAAAGVVVVAAAIAWRGRSWLASRFSPGVGVLAAFLAALFFYYALFFGMPSFLGRYYFPAVTLAAIMVAALIVEGLVVPALPRVVVPLVVAGIACGVGLDLRIYARGRGHEHQQVVDWVTANVEEDTWVAAVQTGTLGYYHDRTINLDGKVDPNAYEYRRRDRICDYVIERNVAYIVDWVGLAEWADRPEFAVNYDLLLRDETRNLAVLQRRRSPDPS